MITVSATSLTKSYGVTPIIKNVSSSLTATGFAMKHSTLGA